MKGDVDYVDWVGPECQGPTIKFDWENKSFTVDFSKASPNFSLYDVRLSNPMQRRETLHRDLDAFLDAFRKSLEEREEILNERWRTP